MALRAPLFSPNFIPKSQTHSFPSRPFSVNFNFKLSCKNDNSISDAELAAEMAKIKTQLVQKEEAMKKSKEILLNEFCKYLGLETEVVKDKWGKMDGIEKMVWAKGFVNDWGEAFHPLSSKSVLEMVDECLVEEKEDPSTVSSTSFNLDSIKKMIGFWE
ncbi:hypothetical protein IFM89_010019 [Coptis chinensis]|uniref:DUF7026 domain-containing protein n=1 Tax=Coptis chinensis TaxID=261450 RepID=A0A835LXF8_9MAGN|nr:hypothetical protein IFM89_010019 [Coptis chinensis]